VWSSPDDAIAIVLLFASSVLGWLASDVGV
jgi:hypothetical protein